MPSEDPGREAPGAESQWCIAQALKVRKPLGESDRTARCDHPISRDGQSQRSEFGADSQYAVDDPRMQVIRIRETAPNYNDHAQRANVYNVQ